MFYNPRTDNLEDILMSGQKILKGKTPIFSYSLYKRIMEILKVNDKNRFDRFKGGIKKFF